MAYFRNNAVNLLNVHMGIHAAVLYGGGAFYFVYLLKVGFSVTVALLVIAAILAGRFAIRPMIVPLAVRFGIKPLLMAGTALSAIQYLVLAEVQDVGPMLIVLCATASIGDVFYWTTYHAYFAALGDSEARGRQIGAREALNAVVGILSPLVTGWILVTFGPRAAFILSAVLNLLATVPLFWTPNVAVKKEAPGVVRNAIPGMLMFLTDGWIAGGNILLWQMVLFITLKEDYVGYGGAMAIAALVGAASALLLGRQIDAGHGKKAALLAVAGLALLIFARAFSADRPLDAVIANALGPFVFCIYVPTIMTAVYNQAQRSACVLRFHVATEGAWDVGCLSACVIAAGLIALGLPLASGILVALAGAVASYFLLRRYYADV